MLIIDMPIEADLVDRAVLYEQLKQWQDAAYDTVTLGFLHEVKMLIGSAPHIKAQELVRCGECANWCEEIIRTGKDGERYSLCELKGIHFGESFFCADGERKDGEHEH